MNLGNYLLLVSSIVIVLALISTFVVLNNKHYRDKLNVKKELMDTAKTIQSGKAPSSPKYTWFLLSTKNGKLVIQSSNTRLADIYKTLLDEESNRILKRAGTGGGFIHLKFRHKEDVSSTDTMAYIVSSEQDGTIAIVMNMNT